MSKPQTHRRSLSAVLIAAAVALGAAACTATTVETDPTTTIDARPSATSATTASSRPSGTTVDEDPPGTQRPSDSDEPDDADDRVPTGNETAEEYSAALVTAFTAEIGDDDEVFSAEAVACVAPEWVDAIGVEAFQAAGVTPAEIADGASGLEDVTLDQAAAAGIVDAVPGCGLPLIDLFIDGLGSSAAADPATRACVEGAVTEEQIRATLIAQIQGVEGGNPKDLVSQCLN